MAGLEGIPTWLDVDVIPLNELMTRRAWADHVHTSWARAKIVAKRYRRRRTLEHTRLQWMWWLLMVGWWVTLEGMIFFSLGWRHFWYFRHHDAGISKNSWKYLDCYSFKISQNSTHPNRGSTAGLGLVAMERHIWLECDIGRSTQVSSVLIVRQFRAGLEIVPIAQ